MNDRLRLGDSAAFPQGLPPEDLPDWFPSGGMTVHTYAAIEMMKGLLANPNHDGEPWEYSADAVKYADALLAELEKSDAAAQD